MKGCFNRGFFVLGIIGTLCALSLNLLAHTTSMPTKTYRVQEGDTLWEIAEHMLGDPLLWQDLWKSSPQIPNPHLIYPGDIVVLSWKEGRPILQAYAPSQGAPGQVVKLQPRIRATPAKKPIPTIPLEVIHPFLSTSKIITQETFEHSPQVVALEEERLVIGKGNVLHATGILHPHPKSYLVYRKGKTFTHPDTQRFLGIEAQVLGRAQLTQFKSLATLSLTKSEAEMQVGDRLLIAPKEEITAFFTPKWPENAVKGYILSVFGGLTQIGQYQVVTLTGGINQHRQVGDVLYVYQMPKDLPTRQKAGRKEALTLPKQRVGQLMVIQTFDDLSFALVTRAIRPIFLMDEVTSG